MIPYFVADQLLQWAEDLNIKMTISEYNYTITSNTTELIQQMPVSFQAIAQSTLNMLDFMFIFGFIVFGIMVVFRLVTSDWFERFETRSKNKRKLQTKSIPFHKRLMLKFGLAEVKESGKR